MKFSHAIKAFALFANVASAVPTSASIPLAARAGTYGSVVDAVDSPPATVSTAPGTLPNRNGGAAASFQVGGNYSAPCSGCLSGDYLLFYSEQYVSLSGTGYFQVRWEVAYFNVAGRIVPPVWSNLSGKLFHVASGGGRRMDDKKTEASTIGCTGNTWMGCPGTSELDTLPSGMQQMWQNEFYFLDGYVELHDTENSVDYNLAISPQTWAEVKSDINTAINDSTNQIRYGKVRDTGNDNCPVPQYATCKEPTTIAGLRAVAQKSSVESC